MRWIPTVLLIMGCGTAACPEPQTAARVETPPVPEEPTRQPAPTLRPPSGSIPVHPLRVLPGPGGFLLLLADESEQRVLPVVIGPSEAHVIDLRMRGEGYERPLTHDLLSTMLERLGAEVLFVHVDKLDGGVFVGSVVLWDGRELHHFDSRTSDAVAIGLGHDVPIYVSPAVFAAAGEETGSAASIPVR